MKPFLDCNIWSVFETKDDFYLVLNVEYYNSDNSEFNKVYDHRTFDIPEVIVKDLHLLEGLDFEFIKTYYIPILKCDTNIWKIDLTHYNRYYKEYYEAEIAML